ncbi:MAG: biotin synthase BioB [Planctomycetota bacterium]
MHTPATPTVQHDPLASLRLAESLADAALRDAPLDPALAESLLADASVDGPDAEAIALPALLSAAYAVRRHHFGDAVRVHVLNNAQNGHCPEDCAYCTQARTSKADINPYPQKSLDEMLDEARAAHASGAHRYCMVFAGRGPSASRTRQLAEAVRRIKQEVDIEVCVSAGLLDQAKAAALADAGVDRYNHNLNTSARNYASICSTHTYDDRRDTLAAARTAGISLCSGLIVGMGETRRELVDLATTLRDLAAESIPVNFLLPFEGNLMNRPVDLTPRYCLRVLALFRLMCPRAEVRVAAGREHHLRSLEPMALQPANSLFLGGYLNARGAEARKLYGTLRDAGYTLDTTADAAALFEGLDEVIDAEDRAADTKPATLTCGGQQPRDGIKSIDELRPFQAAEA